MAFGEIDPLPPPKIARIVSDEDFPCGAGPTAFTVCPTIQGADPGGVYYVIATVLDADVPLDDPVNHYQYGFVFDADGNASNNYVPLPQFANDYFKGTDRWYDVGYTPSGGWQLRVTDARNNNFVEVASAARAMILGDSITLVVPAQEFSSANPTIRQTAFRHSGDFGMFPPFDWSADYHPDLDDPLRPIR